MNKELDPKIVSVVVVVVIVVAALGIYLGTKGQADRSGPVVIAKFPDGGGGRGPATGWRPGMTQGGQMRSSGQGGMGAPAR